MLLLEIRHLKSWRNTSKNFVASKKGGFDEVEFDYSNLPSGVYFYQLKAGEFIATRKMILIK